MRFIYLVAEASYLTSYQIYIDLWFIRKLRFIYLVAEAGLEPATFGLWARRAANCSTPRYNKDAKHPYDLFGGERWIRTIEVVDNRFTVCPLWPLGNLPIYVAWSRRWDSNPQPADYKSAALPVELRRHVNARIIITMHAKFVNSFPKKFQLGLGLAVTFLQISFQFAFDSLQSIVNGFYMTAQNFRNFLIAFTVQIIR